MASLRSPYLFINIPGERAFVMERAMYERATKGVTIVDTTLTKGKIYIAKTLYRDAISVGKHDDVWVYTVKHETLLRTGRIARGSTRFFNLLQTRYSGVFWKFEEEMVEWGERCLAAIQPKASKHERALVRLQKQLAKAIRAGTSDDVESLQTQIESIKALAGKETHGENDSHHNHSELSGHPQSVQGLCRSSAA